MDDLIQDVFLAAFRQRHQVREPGMSPERRALLSKVYQVLEGLPIEQRLAWTLRFVEGEKLEDVAQQCACSLATAKRRISAAHARIQAELDDG